MLSIQAIHRCFAVLNWEMAIWKKLVSTRIFLNYHIQVKWEQELYDSESFQATQFLSLPEIETFTITSPKDFYHKNF